MSKQKQQQKGTSGAQTADRKGIRLSLLSLICGVGLIFFALLLPNPSIHTASAHAVPVRSEPAANALLRTPPTHQ